ncbi:hypothetical protein CXF70_09335 [Planomicrobium sp. MB-3u-38]|nr:hypothetical protein CXF70_09335 [Planomicrobium sp. MB-3u-38]
MAMLFLFFIVRSLQQLPEFKSLDGCFSPKPGRKAGNLEFKNIVDVFRIAKNSFFKEIFADAEIFSIWGFGEVGVGEGRDGGKRELLK